MTSTPTGTPMPGANRLVNPGFELDSNADGRPDAWTSSSMFLRSNEAVHGGSYAGKLFASSDAGEQIQQVVMNITAGATYQFAGWVNIPATQDAFTFNLVVRWRDANANTVGTHTVKTYTRSTAGWEQTTASLVAPAGADRVQIRMTVTSLNGAIYVDDFSFWQ
jgi:hypothetical protein